MVRSFGSTFLSSIAAKRTTTTESTKRLEDAGKDSIPTGQTEKASDGEQQPTESPNLARERRNLVTRRNMYKLIERKLNM